MLDKLLPQEHTHFPGKTLIVSQNDIEDHKKPIDGAGILQVYLDVQRGAGDRLPPCPDGVDTAPWKHWPPEGTLFLIVIVDGGTNLLKQCLGSVNMILHIISRSVGLCIEVC